jgi:hypothetical protein
MNRQGSLTAPFGFSKYMAAPTSATPTRRPTPCNLPLNYAKNSTMWTKLSNLPVTSPATSAMPERTPRTAGPKSKLPKEFN